MPIKLLAEIQISVHKVKKAETPSGDSGLIHSGSS